MSVTSAARKKTSKIYQDLNTTRLHNTSLRKLSIMDRVLKVFVTQPRGTCTTYPTQGTLAIVHKRIPQAALQG